VVNPGFAPVKVILYSKPDCHLCDEMKQVLEKARQGIEVTVEEVDISSDRQLLETYGEEIPVLFVDGRKAFKYQVSEKDLRRRLLRAAAH
jgi:glutaredoxin